MNFSNHSNQFSAPKKELIIANYITAYKSNIILELTLWVYKILLKIFKEKGFNILHDFLSLLFGKP